MLSLLAVIGLFAERTISNESSQTAQGTDCEADLALENTAASDTYTSVTCPLDETGTQGVMQQQIDNNTESEEFFVGCGTIM